MDVGLVVMFKDSSRKRFVSKLVEEDARRVYDGKV
jgi:hypothetical protein